MAVTDIFKRVFGFGGFLLDVKPGDLTAGGYIGESGYGTLANESEGYIDPRGTPMGDPYIRGYVNTFERDRRLAGPGKYARFGDMARNSWVVATGLNMYMDLLTRSKWAFQPAKWDGQTDADAGTAAMLAAAAERIVMEDPASSFMKIVRKTAMYKFNGYSVQNWWVKRSSEGYFTLADIEERPVSTIQEIETSDYGLVLGFHQQTSTGRLWFIPSFLTLYLADDALTDQPEGIGLFRHLWQTYNRRERYEQILGYGYETDLRGMPVASFPIEETKKSIKESDPRITDGDLAAKVMARMQHLTTFIRNHVKTPDQGVVLDSAVYVSDDERQNPIRARKQELTLLENNASSFADIDKSIIRTDMEMARIMGVEQVLLGGSSQGSYALSQDQTTAFALKVESVLQTIANAVREQVLRRVFWLNGWDAVFLPMLKTETPRYFSPELQARILSILNALNLPDEDTAPDEIRVGGGLPLRPRDAQGGLVAAPRPETMPDNSGGGEQ